ncbi:hypothetical protein SETIT_9G357900v2 [Setaria italica]|uniref:Uncharacterized protein n=1 Tax=Setaria italica TaxID=4555 RepID=A0A368SPG0_SETIT|nr:hypothetical protein SETIT_9G357900v2 [Setaria italica]
MTVKEKYGGRDQVYSASGQAPAPNPTPCPPSPPPCHPIFPLPPAPAAAAPLSSPAPSLPPPPVTRTSAIVQFPSCDDGEDKRRWDEDRARRSASHSPSASTALHRALPSPTPAAPSPPSAHTGPKPRGWPQIEAPLTSVRGAAPICRPLQAVD